MKSKIFLLLILFNLLVNKTITADKKRKILFYASGRKVFIYDVKNKGNLRLLSEGITAQDKINSLFYFKDKLYLATKKGIEIWDVKNTYHPFLINFLSLKEDCEDIKVINSYMCLLTGKELKIYNIENLNNPYEISSLSAFGYPLNFFIYKNYCYVADRKEGLKIIDIKDIYNPYEIGYYKEIKPVLDVYGGENLVYLACGKRGLAIIDTKLKRFPEELINYQVRGYSFALFYEKPYIYMATDIGLSVINVKDPYSPKEIDYYESESNIKDVFINFPYAYLDSEEGLEIVKIGEKKNFFTLLSFFYFIILILIIVYIIYRVPQIYRDWKEKIRG